LHHCSDDGLSEEGFDLLSLHNSSPVDGGLAHFRPPIRRRTSRMARDRETGFWRFAKPVRPQARQQPRERLAGALLLRSPLGGGGAVCRAASTARTASRGTKDCGAAAPFSVRFLLWSAAFSRSD
jgi:hypothetical protein